MQTVHGYSLIVGRRGFTSASPLDLRDKMGESVPSTSIASPGAAEDDEDMSFGAGKSNSRKGGFASGFAGLSLEDSAPGGAEEEDEDFGGLMV